MKHAKYLIVIVFLLVIGCSTVPQTVTQPEDDRLSNQFRPQLAISCPNRQIYPHPR